MANTTVRGALSIHGQNPQFLVERVIRGRIYESLFWKEQCFALNAATIIDQALKLKYAGGTYGNQKPSEFLCLTLKLLQIQPDRAIIYEYLKAEEFKYLRALAAFYVRLTFEPLTVHEVLEPLLDDYRKIIYRSMDGSYSVTTIDQFIDDLLHEERVCDIQLPRLTQRRVLEETEGLAKRRSKLAEALNIRVESDEESEKEDAPRIRSRSGSHSSSASDRFVSRSPSRSPSPERFLSRSPSRSRSPSPERYISQSPEQSEGE